MSRPTSLSTLRGFTFLEVLLVMGIVGMMILCLFGFILSRTREPLKIPAPLPTATPAPAVPPADLAP